MVSGWKYFKMGKCADCHREEGARLYVPVLEGARLPNTELVSGSHIPHFDPVCKSCSGKYSLDIICDKHRLPLRVETGQCKLCLIPKLGRYSPTTS